LRERLSLIERHDHREAVMEAHYRFDGSIDYEFHRRDARRHRDASMRDFLTYQQPKPRLRPVARQRIRMFAAAFALATAAFWTTMATMPPTTEAGSLPAGVQLRAP